MVTDVVDRRLAACDEATDSCEALTEGTHDEVYLVRQAEVIADATAVVAHDAEAVGLIDHDRGLVLLRQAADLGQVAQVTLHREDPVDDDELDTLGVALL